jgi:phosphoribosyl-ATP pyrophosphohydrolase
MEGCARTINRNLSDVLGDEPPRSSLTERSLTMAKPTKKKVVSSLSTNNKKRAAKAKKLQRPGGGFTIDFDPVTQVNHFRAPESPPLPRALERHASPEVLNRLWTVIESRKAVDPGVSHSARLLAKGTARFAQKLGEEAVECVIEAMTGNRVSLIGENADVLYHLLDRLLRSLLPSGIRSR